MSVLENYLSFPVGVSCLSSSLEPKLSGNPPEFQVQSRGAHSRPSICSQDHGTDSHRKKDHHNVRLHRHVLNRPHVLDTIRL